MPSDEAKSGEESLHLFKAPEIEQPQPEQKSDLDSRRPTALVHVLTPEFHGFDLEDFADIPDEVVARASAEELKPLLFWAYVPKDRRETQEVSAFSYLSAEEGFISVALTPEEYNAGSESVDKLAQRMFIRVLSVRDETLRKSTGDNNARARSSEDMRTAKRGAMRAVIQRQTRMEGLLDEEILPRVHLIERFLEMTEGRNPNLARGTRQTVSQRFELLRTTVFDDMLDAIALQRDWKSDMTARAKNIIQKRLYFSGTPSDRLANFKEMIKLAQDYYGHKRALILTKIEDAKKYQRANPEVVADIMTVDEHRQRERKNSELRLFEDEA